MPTPTTGSTFSLISPSTIDRIDAVLGGTRWGPVDLPTGPLEIRYSFANVGSLWSTDGTSGYGATNGGGEPWNGFVPFDEGTRNQVRQIFASLEAVIDVDFVEVTETSSSVGDLRFAFTSALGNNVLGYTYFPGGSYSVATSQGSAYANAGDIWINADQAVGFDPYAGSYAYLTLLHEISHALGLKHPFEVLGQFGTLPTAEDSYDYTVMSYSSIAGSSQSGMNFYPTSLMTYDVFALQYLYGANTSYHNGNDTYVFRQGEAYNQTIWDTGGIDTLRYDASSDGATIDLRDGQWQALGASLDYFDIANPANDITSDYTVQILPGVVLENAIGGQGADSISGNGSANNLAGRGGNDRLEGRYGNDTLAGGDGNDTMVGGHGNDTYYVGQPGDRIIEYANQGRDLVNSWIDRGLGANQEDLTLLGSKGLDGQGNSLANRITGNSAANRLDGFAGNDTLAGGNGSDTMVGGAGNDTYYVGQPGDRIVEYANQGRDLVNSWIDRGLGANQEDLTLLGSKGLDGQGNSLSNRITGNSAANRLDGFAGNDTLSGGLGNDTLMGGDGNDLLIGGRGVDLLGGGGGHDAFLFNSELNGQVDRITDFSHADDTLRLDDAIFSALGPPGSLAAGVFRTGTVALDGNDHLLYDTVSGLLSYDVDGNGSAAAVAFARFGWGTPPTLAADDFLIV